jgi:transketolase
VPVSVAALTSPALRDRFAQVVGELLDSDPRVAVVLADIGADRLRRAARRHPKRVLNVGIREQLLIGVTAGLAAAGLRPVAHTYAPFLVERPFEQLKLDLGHQDLGAILVSVGASYDWAEGGRTHQAPEDVALVASLPGWTIHVPGHADELEPLLREAARGDDRVYIRLSEQRNRSPVAADGRLTVVRGGGRAAVVAVGPTLDPVLEATGDLDVTVAYASTVRPLDADGLRAVAEPPDVVLVEPYLAGTSSATVVEALIDRPHRVLALGVANVEHRRYGSRTEHDAAHGLDAAGIRRSIERFLRASPA